VVLQVKDRGERSLDIDCRIALRAHHEGKFSPFRHNRNSVRLDASDEDKCQTKAVLVGFAVAHCNLEGGQVMLLLLLPVSTKFLTSQQE
jgi:hypothetical protein